MMRNGTERSGMATVLVSLRVQAGDVASTLKDDRWATTTWCLNGPAPRLQHTVRRPFSACCPCAQEAHGMSQLWRHARLSGPVIQNQ